MKQLFEITSGARKTDRYFLARVDGRPTIFVLHGDRSITVAPGPELGPIEPAEDVIGSLRGLAGIDEEIFGRN
jgi:hypothetical protein